MWSFNPAVYLRHAWDSTSTPWGRVSLLLFYTFIWVGIILGIWSVISPESLGINCLFDAASSEDLATIRVLMRGMNLFLVGFLFYADKSGLHSWNVGMVAAFCLVWSWIWTSFLSDANIPECGAVWGSTAWIWPAWIVLALVGILLEEKLGDNGTAEERQNLNV